MRKKTHNKRTVVLLRNSSTSVNPGKEKNIYEGESKQTERMKKIENNAIVYIQKSHEIKFRKQLSGNI